MKTITILATVNVQDGESLGDMVLSALSTLARPIAKKAVLSIQKVDDSVEISSNGNSIGSISLYSIENPANASEVNPSLLNSLEAKESHLPTIVENKATPIIGYRLDGSEITLAQ